eukprot:1837878-Amphidinium_carterae.1
MEATTLLILVQVFPFSSRLDAHSVDCMVLLLEAVTISPDQVPFSSLVDALDETKQSNQQTLVAGASCTTHSSTTGSSVASGPLDSMQCGALFNL